MCFLNIYGSKLNADTSSTFTKFSHRTFQTDVLGDTKCLKIVLKCTKVKCVTVVAMIYESLSDSHSYKDNPLSPWIFFLYCGLT